LRTIRKNKPMFKTNQIPELLAPAGSMDSIYAAIKGGADAVYFGGSFANARNAAKNFSGEEISAAVKLLHDHGKYAYITLNILHTDRELSSLLKFAEHCYINGADAFIIQDIGLSQIIKNYFPDIKIHASTQAAGHNLNSAKRFFDLGFSRMIAARELDRENLKYLIDNSPVEIEIFIHGALCSSHSGRCFMSFALGNTRSANRGMCAQPCRMQYNNKYALSLKDLCLAGYIKEIIEFSPASLKIEGRMKPPAYVYNVCKIYRTCLDENRNATNQEIDLLAKIFSRQGFTDGYFTKNLGVRMYGVRTNENKLDSQNYAIPQNTIRRNCVGDLADTARRVPTNLSNLQISNIKNIKINPKLCLIFNSSEQFSQVSEYIKADEILKKIYKIFLPVNHQIKIPDEYIKITGLKLPYVLFDNEREQIINAIKNTPINSVLIDNIGHINFVSGANIELFGNFGLNITNSYTLEEYKKMGLHAVILSPELNFAQIRDINKSINCGIVAYGKTHVMISENCLIRNNFSCKVNILNNINSCGFTGNFYLTDKTNAKFLVCGDYGHRNIIYNSVPIYLADKKDSYKNLGLFFISLNFTDENPNQIKKIISDYIINKNTVSPPEKFTRGYK